LVKERPFRIVPFPFEPQFSLLSFRSEFSFFLFFPLLSSHLILFLTMLTSSFIHSRISLEFITYLHFSFCNLFAFFCFVFIIIYFPHLLPLTFSHFPFHLLLRLSFFSLSALHTHLMLILMTSTIFLSLSQRAVYV